MERIQEQRIIQKAGNCSIELYKNTSSIYVSEADFTEFQEDLDDRLIDAEFIMAFMIKKYLKSIENLDMEE